MQVHAFPGCCTARIITGFGQEANAGYTARAEQRYTEDTMKHEVHRLLTGPQIGRHYGLVFATLTTRQTMGIKVLTEMGFKDTGAKDKTGHRETDLHGFYICPAEYIDSDYAKALVQTPPPAVKRYVKDLNYHSAQRYRRLMTEARLLEREAGLTTNPASRAQWLQHAQVRRNVARAMLDNPAYFS